MVGPPALAAGEHRAARRLAAGLVLLPLTFLVVEAQQSGWSEVERLLFRHTVAVLLWNTLRLAVACTLLCALLGVGAAWCVERTDAPRAPPVGGRCSCCRSGIPDFVVGFGWVSLEPGLHGYLAAVMVMTLSLYPLVYLPVRSGARATSTPASRRPRAASAWARGARSGGSRCARSARRCSAAACS